MKVTLLSTMLTNHAGVGEWGFAAVVEADGQRILFDTGKRPTVALQNAEELQLDLAGITDVVLSHNHDDHTGGLVHLRTELRRKNPAALARAHVARGIFWRRLRDGAPPPADMAEKRAAYEGVGGTFVEHDGPFQLLPGVWLTGPVPRTTRETGPAGKTEVESPAGLVRDTIPEDQAIVLDTPEGLVVVAGCAHAGIVNTLRYAREVLGPKPIHAVVGGLHFFPLEDADVVWAADEMKAMGVRHLLGAHCTGINQVFTLRERLGGDRRTVAVGAVGSTFELGRGIEAGLISR